MEENIKENIDKEYSHKNEDDKQTDLDTEIRAGEWQSLRKFKTYRQRSRQGKILATYQAVSNRLRQMEQVYYQLVRNHPKKSLKLLEQIKQLRLVQDILLQCLSWSGRDEDSNEAMDDILPDELRELIV